MEGLYFFRNLFNNVFLISLFENLTYVICVDQSLGQLVGLLLFVLLLEHFPGQVGYGLHLLEKRERLPISEPVFSYDSEVFKDNRDDLLVILQAL